MRPEWTESTDCTIVRVTATVNAVDATRGSTMSYALILDTLSANLPVGNNQSSPSNIQSASTIPFGLQALSLQHITNQSFGGLGIMFRRYKSSKMQASGQFEQDPQCCIVYRDAPAITSEAQ